MKNKKNATITASEELILEGERNKKFKKVFPNHFQPMILKQLFIRKMRKSEIIAATSYSVKTVTNNLASMIKRNVITTELRDGNENGHYYVVGPLAIRCNIFNCKVNDFYKTNEKEIDYLLKEMEKKESYKPAVIKQ